MSLILAKAPFPGRDPKTLCAHTMDVMDSFQSLFGQVGRPSRLGQRWIRFFKLTDFRRFHACTFAAAAFHDWGKANQGFQDVLEGRGQQLIRHEHLSALLLGLSPIKKSLALEPELDLQVILGAVISHHLKAKDEDFAVKQHDGTQIQLLWNSDEFQQMLRETSKRLGLRGSLGVEVAGLWSFGPKPGHWDLVPHREAMKQELHYFGRDLTRDETRRRLLWAVRAALIAADAVGSAVVRLKKPLADWIEEAFDERRVCTEATISQAVINPRIQELKHKNRWDQQKGRKGWSKFQEDCAELPDRALLLAPCGSGKTLAAWRWIGGRLHKPAARVIFLYPTRATATEGFRDYVSWAPEADAALIHGTAAYDLDGMFSNPPDSPKDPRESKVFEVDQRLFAIAFWERRIFSATVDQFLAFLQYQYASVCLLPLLADSVVVFDEIHSFDRGMFSAVKQFLRIFDVPVLCMTATLPENRRRDLEVECGLHVYADRPEDLKIVAEYPRYQLAQATADQVPRKISDALQRGKRVLWVLNQVKRVQDAARRFARRFPDSLLRVDPDVPLFCYHSRFKLDDRIERHRDLVSAFQNGKGPLLGITTQVCEMSLDLDADLLVTEHAPITALIQRMGRCNRARIPKNGKVGDVLAYAPEDVLPYTPELLAGVSEFLADLEKRPAVSQADLEAALEAPYAPRQVELPKACQFLESGAYAKAREDTFRDIEEFTIPAVLDTDVQEFAAKQKARKPTDGLVVPVPRKLGGKPPQELPAYMAIASSRHYHPLIGFTDDPLE
jgi:CRISPR-associated endonuclease/helicase Cas3